MPTSLDPVRLETRTASAPDWRCLVGMSDDVGARAAYEAACRCLSDDCLVRLVVHGVVWAERGAKAFDGLGLA
jgi:hypothetical protein